MGIFEVERTPLRIVDSVAVNDPGTLYCIHPVSSDISEGWVNVDFEKLVDAINRTALWIQENVASSTEPETIAYVGANDIRYTAFIFACMRLRHTVRNETYPRMRIAYLLRP
jgi:acyl-CoA synthetase (AMP-forming)/AMP-acid ligase II